MQHPLQPLIKVKEEFLTALDNSTTTRIPTPPMFTISDQFSLAEAAFHSSVPQFPPLRQVRPDIQGHRFERAIPRGNNIVYKGFRYYKDGANIYKKTQQLRTYWRCTNIPGKCRARVHTDPHFIVVKVVGGHELSCVRLLPTLTSQTR